MLEIAKSLSEHDDPAPPVGAWQEVVAEVESHSWLAGGEQLELWGPQITQRNGLFACGRKIQPGAVPAGAHSQIHSKE